MQKGFAQILFLVGIMIVVAVAGGAYYLQSKETFQAITILPLTTTEIANWKTYRNTDYKYEIKIPNDWEAVKREGNKGMNNIIDLQPRGVNEVPPLVISARGIVYLMVTDHQSPAEIINSAIDDQVGKNYPRDKKVINGKEWFFYTNKRSSRQIRDIHYFIFNRFLYEIDGFASEKGYINVLNQILSTFRFD